MITEETISRVKSSLQATKSILVLEIIESLEKENAELKGYKDIVDTIKAEGFETFCDVRMFLQHHKELEEELVELKAHCKAVDEVTKKMKCCENCEHCGSDNEIGENGDYTDYTCIQCNDLETEENLYPNWELKK